MTDIEIAQSCKMQPIGEIAARCGYQTLSNFNRQFRSRYGKSPRRCREESRIPCADTCPAAREKSCVGKL